MIAYHFRFVDDDGEPTGYMGTAFTKTKDSLFWEIDRYGDPHRSEIKPATCGSFCCKVGEQDDRTGDWGDDTEYEISESTPIFYTDGWIKPTWSRDWASMYLKNRSKNDQT
ncbi:MAG: hypothetical protein WBI20_15025 [Burkholderiaceae bacterium]